MQVNKYLTNFKIFKDKNNGRSHKRTKHQKVRKEEKGVNKANQVKYW